MWIWVTTAVALWAVSPLRATPLDDYVHRKDPHYQYSEIGSYRGPEYTMYILNMTSQKWKTGRFRLFTKCIIFFFFFKRRLKCINQWMDTHSYYAVGNFLIRLCCKGGFVWGLFQIFGEGGCMVEIGCGEERTEDFIGGHILQHLNGSQCCLSKTKTW